MSLAHTILLVPHDQEVVQEGPCAEAPPAMHHNSTGKRWYVGGGYEVDALVIAYDGKPHEIGCMYAAIAGAFEPRRVVAETVQMMLDGDTLDDLHERLGWMGTLIYLDADGEALDGE